MSNRPGKGRSPSQKIALGGVFAALSIVLMLLGGVLPIATFTAPIFASLCLIPVLVELGGKTALLLYAAVALLSFFLVPDTELVLFFALLAGYYPILQPRINRLRLRPVRLLLKLLVFNAAVAAVYGLLLLLFTSPALQRQLAGRGGWFWGALLLLGNLTFVLYDSLIDRVRFLYIHRFRRRFFH